ncbi:hypothetical protein [Variovorax sp. 770b2]|jgi:hypothetical protein|uniref:hypothetical protein n=1 Tax=Variovorax sp. 770b2 TaxID=1566271 RepID=UPI0008ECD0D9|nr:hypothetical protein [Variovorax sp. 770b2]SFP54897.1 hypothetical protein SAMN03159339_3058 [Variovorax sp. 770b2]
MNTESNTPPNGDFARYVEQLAARAAQPKRAAQPGEPGLDVGMTPSPGQQGPVTAAMQRADLPNGEAHKRESGSFDPMVLKVLGAVGALVFLVLWSIGVPFFVLVAGGVAAVWFGKTFFKGLKLTPGVAKWQQVLEEAARKQREQQQHKQGSK